MLVLTRETNESVVIDDDVTVTVLEVRDGKVRLGIRAPREKKVDREEVYERINGHPHPNLIEVWALIGKPKPRQSRRRRSR